MGKALDAQEEMLTGMRILSSKYKTKKAFVDALTNASGVSASMITKVYSRDRKNPSAVIIDRLATGIYALQANK